MPCLLLHKSALVKTIKFKNMRYIGDPINTVRIFNEQEVDELIFLDITATRDKREIDFPLIKEIATECFMPFAYGGGIKTVDDVKQLFSIGVEKVVLNSITFTQPQLITEIAKLYGSQSIVISIDVKKNWLNRYIIHKNGKMEHDPLMHAYNMVQAGAGEVLVTSVNQDGTMQGYDLNITKLIAEKVNVPVIACGGAGKLSDLKKAIDAGASAVALGSMVIYQGKNRAVLTSFPSQDELTQVLE